MFVLGYFLGAISMVALIHFWPSIKTKIEKLGDFPIL